MIEARNLFRLESQLKKKNKTISVKSLEKDYVLTWILTGIAKSRMNTILCFKGGTALKKFYFHNYRFSEYLDFTVLSEVSFEELEEMMEEMFILVLELSNIRLSLKKKEMHENSYIFYVNFTGPLGADITKSEIKMDFTLNEKMVRDPAIRSLLKEYEEYKDIPEGITLQVYPLEEIFIEKIISILDYSRNEPRDIYDLWYLLFNSAVDYLTLDSEIVTKGLHKGISQFNVFSVLEQKERNYKNLWELRLDRQVIELPYFNDVYRALKRYLKPLVKKLQ